MDELLIKPYLIILGLLLAAMAPQAQTFIWDSTGKPRLDVPSTGIGIGDVKGGKYAGDKPIFLTPQMQSLSTLNVAWKLIWMEADINGVFAFAAGDTTSVRQAGSGTAFTHQIVNFPTLVPGFTNVSGIISGVLICDAARNSDTYTGDAAFLDFGFHYRKDSFGSRWEFVK